jgi:DNA-binding transcriptional regulator PaaX
MTRAQEIRHEVLLQLYGSQVIAISIEHIKRVCKRAGFDYSETELRDALFFLRGQGFAEYVVDEGTGEQRYRITSKGTLHYENHE